MINWAEKRQHKRVDIRLMVEYRSKGAWQMTEARDLSLGGLFVSADKIEPPQTKVEVMFDIGKDAAKKTINAEGIVTWSRKEPVKAEDGELLPAGMGIMFTKITPMLAKSDLKQLIETEDKKSAHT